MPEWQPRLCTSLRSRHLPTLGGGHFFFIQGFTHADQWGIIRRQ